MNNIVSSSETLQTDAQYHNKLLSCATINYVKILTIQYPKTAISSSIVGGGEVHPIQQPNEK